MVEFPRPVLRKEGDLYVAEYPELGTVSQGVTVKEAVDNLKVATELYHEEFPPDRPRPVHTKEAITKRRNPR